MASIWPLEETVAGRELAALRRGLALLEGSDVGGLLLADGEERIRWVNDAAVAMYGRPFEALCAMRLGELRHATAPAPAAKASGDHSRVASVHGRADGSPFPVEVSLRPLLLDGAAHTLVAVRDTTEERLQQAAFEEGTALHRALFRDVPMIQFALDEEGRFALLEGRGLRGIGLKPGELLGRPLVEFANDAPELIAGYLRAWRGERSYGLARIGRRTFEIHWTPLHRGDGSVRGVAGVGLDVTARLAAERARKETQARLVAAERLASMGRLAAGIAHEINNPLAWLISNLEVAVARIGAEDVELRELLGDAHLGAIRVRDIVRDLRVFARSDGEKGSGCDAVAVARASLAMARNELRHRARVETSFEPAPEVAIPQRQLGQVLVNLLVNAAQSIREGAADRNLVRLAVRPAGGGAVVEVQDTGSGMAPEIRGRIFEPFFSTKGGEGMGLGLALCQAMVQEAGGRIEVESAPGAGSTFRVWLPASAAEAERRGAPPPTAPAAPVAVAAAVAPPGSRPRLLLVDDEPLIGRSVIRALPEYEVEYVGDAREALARIRAGVRYDGLICDLMMPEMTGMDLAQRLADERSALAERVIFLTGGAFTERARAFTALTRAPIVEKPFEQAALQRAVAALLGAPAARYGVGAGASPNR